MIENEKQYQISLSWAERFSRTLQDLEKRYEGTMDELMKAERDGVASQLSDLREEIQEYEDRNGLSTDRESSRQ